MKIPPNAKLVFKGVLFDVYHWQQKMFDGSYETFERLKRADTVQIIPEQNGKIIIAQEEQPGRRPFTTLLGGRMEPNETPLAAAKRELVEESGLSSNDWELYAIYKPFSKVDWEIYYFIARNCKIIKDQNLDSGEKIQLKKVTFDQFMKFATSKECNAGEFTTDMLRLSMNKKKLLQFKRKLLQS